MQFIDKYGPWAIVAGSAEGLGEAWSRTLARRGLNLVMVDHQKDKLVALASELKQNYNIDTSPVWLDLMDDDATMKIMEHSKKVDCRLLIYNAAYSKVQAFLDNTADDIRHYAGINTYTQLNLVHTFSKELSEQKKSGGIILMSSLAGLLGMQFVAAYAATKAFSWNLAEALYHELKPNNIDVMACIAGATSTPAYLGTKPKYGMIKPQLMKPEEVTEEAIRKLGKKARHICGWSNRLNYFILTRLLARKFAARMANRVMKKMYAHE